MVCGTNSEGETVMVINFNYEQTRKIELLALWRCNPMDDKAAVASMIVALVDRELAKVRTVEGKNEQAST